MTNLSIWSIARRWAVLAAALAVLNVSLAFENLWPTPAIRATSKLSVELAVFLLVLALTRRAGAPSRSALRRLSIAWVILVVLRYADVTTLGLFGRQINLYWDLRLLPNVAGMLTAVASPALVAAAVAALVLIPLLLYVPLRWAVGHVCDAAADAAVRRVLVMIGALGIVLFPFQHTEGEGMAELPKFSAPITSAIAGQVTLFMQEATGLGLPPLGPQPSLDSNFGRVKGADVLLVFLESYGAVAWDNPAFSAALAPARQRFATAIHDSGRDVVTALVGSPTFGGGSWLAHLNLLSGTEVRDQNTNVRLMAQKRDTLVTAFGRHGYRTVAVMPGLQQAWPEGAFYGFDEVYGTRRLDYRGPTFGWWDLTDQFTLARMDELVVAPRDRAPAFVFFPTISTHTPFVPTPPYQPDWPRMLTAQPYDQDALQAAWEIQPNWENLGPAYAQSLAYAFDSLGGYLTLRADRDFVLIVVGDHQPPSLVSGEGAPWDVPVHVITSRPAVLEALRQHGFASGLAPRHPAVAPMHTLMSILLDTFDDRE